MIDSKVALKWAIAQIKKTVAEKPKGGIKTETDSYKYTEIQEELERLYAAAVADTLKLVTKCKNCKAYSGGEKRGSCFPKSFSAGRLANDFCSRYENDQGVVRRGLY